VLRRISGPMGDKVTGEQRQEHNEELRNCTLNQILLDQLKEDETGGACSTDGEMRNACKILVGNQEDPDIDRRLIS